jgi:MFS family permease
MADTNYEMALAVLPLFLTSGLGAPAYAIGLVEGVADGSSAVVKVASGWYSDRTPRRRGLAVAGYAATVFGFAVFAIVGAWPQAVAARAAGWMGRGLRQPIRSAMLAGSVARRDLGKAFGFHEALDTFGALAGPAIAYLLLMTGAGYRRVFEVAIVPGVLCVLMFALLTRDPRRPTARAERLRWTPLPGPFWRLVVAVAVFGAGNFATAFFILRAAAMLRPEYSPTIAASGGVLFFLASNAVGAAGSFPGGWMADRIGSVAVVAGAYALFAAACVAGMLLHGPAGVAVLALLVGLSTPLVVAQESSIAGGVVGEAVAGTAFGVLAAVNGVGDLVSSVAAGLLWTWLGPAYALGYGALLAAAGAVLIAVLNPARVNHQPPGP